MLRIILGYLSTSRSESPAVLYCGHDGHHSQEAINSAPEKIVRFERIEGVHGFPGRRDPGATPGPDLGELPIGQVDEEVAAENAKLRADVKLLGRLLEVASAENASLLEKLQGVAPVEIPTTTEANGAPASTDHPAVEGTPTSESESTSALDAEAGEDVSATKKKK